AAAATVPDGMQVSVTSIVRRAPWQAAAAGASHEFGALLTAALTDDGRMPARRGFPYWMESALWEEAGIPTVVCGPAGGGLHAVDEWVDLGQRRAFPGAVVRAVE